MHCLAVGKQDHAQVAALRFRQSTPPPPTWTSHSQAGLRDLRGRAHVGEGPTPLRSRLQAGWIGPLGSFLKNFVVDRLAVAGFDVATNDDTAR